MKTVKLVCSGCGIEFDRYEKEVKRSIAKGRTATFCNLKCRGKTYGKVDGVKHLKKFWGTCNQNLIRGSERDEFSLFKPFIRTSKYRHKWSKTEKYSTEMDLTLEHLSDLWKHQNGKCIYTGVDLVLRVYEEKAKNPNYTASLDRIDKTKGYSIGNVQFVSLTLNWLKNSYDDEHIKEFFTIVRDMTSFGDE